MKFTKLPNDAFAKLQLNAGILVDNFEPSTGTIGNLMGATTGGINFASNPSYEDFGADVDNCPENMMELKRLIAFAPQMGGTFLTVTPELAKMLVGAADIDSNSAIHVIPRNELEAADFSDVWWIGDYSDVNTGADAGFLAIHLKRALNQNGFQIQSTKNAKGNMSFEFHGHYTLADQEDVPFEIYCRNASVTPSPYILLNKHEITIKVGDDYTLTAEKYPANATVTWNSSATGKATVSNGVVHGAAEGSTIITASITDSGVTYNDTCTVVVEAAS